MGKYKTPLSFQFDIKTKDAMLTEFIEQIAKTEIKSHVKFVLIRTYQLQLEGRNKMSMLEFAAECGENIFNMYTKQEQLIEAGWSVKKVIVKGKCMYEFTVNLKNNEK